MSLGDVSGRLAGKVAIVTGAGQTPGETIGNGKAMALLFARAGANVLCVDRDGARAADTVAGIESQGGVGRACAADISKAEDARRIVQECIDAFGRVDILVNNVKQRSGAIVNISSLASIAGGFQMAYEVSKAAMNRMTRSVALSGASRGVRCNAITPGLMDTPMAIGGIAAARGMSEDTLREERAASVPMKFMGTGWDTAHAALFLASDEARFITGAILPVDGGGSARVG